PSGAPSLFTFNGFGTMLYGAEEHDVATQTHIATAYSTLCFLPILPQCSYIVQPAGFGRWYFLGAVPLARFHRVWRWIAAIVPAVAGLCGVALIWFLIRKSDVHFVNDLDVPVQVTLADGTFVVAPGSDVTRSMKVQVHHVAVQALDGATIDERDVRVPGATD